jgi:hypothetical protein
VIGLEAGVIDAAEPDSWAGSQKNKPTAQRPSAFSLEPNDPGITVCNPPKRRTAPEGRV